MRTDIHRPSSEHFDPENYEFVSCFYLGENRTPDEVEHYRKVIQQLRNQGLKRFGALYNCAHCGARISYLAVMINRASGEFLHIGETCLSNRFELTKNEFKNLREAQRLNRERLNRAERAAKFCEENPAVRELVDFVKSDSENLYSAEFLTSLLFQFERDGFLSEKQVNAIRPAIERERKAAQIRQERESARAELMSAGVRAPEGKVTFEGVILGFKIQESDFGSVEKMIVKTAEGWTVYVSTPSNISPDKGDTVRLTATLTPSDSDPLFAFGKRPSKAQIVSQGVN